MKLSNQKLLLHIGMPGAPSHPSEAVRNSSRLGLDSNAKLIPLLKHTKRMVSSWGNEIYTWKAPIMNPAFFAYGALAIAIVCEVIGTSFLMKSEQFTKLVPTLFMALFYAGSFFFLSQALKMLPLGVAYAIWGGLGIVLTALIGVFVFRQTLDPAAIIGIGMIVGGVVVVNVFSNAVPH